jgi:hypothetical protein
MAWNGNSYPDGNKNLPDNRVGIADNFDYIETKMDLDHFWTDGDADNNGRHQFVNMPTNAADVTKERDGVLYVKTVGSEHELYYRNSTAVVPITGGGSGHTWAHAVFNPGAGTPTLVSSNNIASVTYSGGVFTFTFTTAAPSADYMVIGGITNNPGAATANRRFMSVAVSGEDGSNVTTASFKVVLIDASGGVTTGSSITVTETYVMAVI